MWTQSPASPHSEPQPPHTKCAPHNRFPPGRDRARRGESREEEGQRKITTLPKGSQGDEASPDHYLPIRVDCDHRSKLRRERGGGGPRTPPPSTNQPTHPTPPEKEPKTKPTPPGLSAALRGGAWRGAERGPPPALPLPAAGRAHRRASSAPRSPCGAPHRVQPRTAPHRSAQPRGSSSAPHRTAPHRTAPRKLRRARCAI